MKYRTLAKFRFLHSEPRALARADSPVRSQVQQIEILCTKTLSAVACLLMTVVLCSASGAPAAPRGRVVYVNVAADGFDEGTSWADAYTDLQDGLDDVELTGDCLPESPCEIWVAKGTYFPSRRIELDDPTSATFKMMNNVGVYGGFGGWETERRQREIDLNETILDGDLNMDDDPTLEPTSNCCVARLNEGGCDDPVCQQIVVDILFPFLNCAERWESLCAGVATAYCCEICRPSYCDNSGPVVLAASVDATAVLDGVTITSGEEISSGAGLYTEESDPIVRNCIFTKHSLRALLAIDGQPTFENCSFTQNRGWGAETHNTEDPSSEPSFTNCDFVENAGAGLLYDSSKLISGCRFIRNGDRGLWLRGGAPNIHHCLFLENAQGMVSSGFPQLVNCAFFGNGSNRRPTGGLNADNIILINCVFSGNVGEKYGAFFVDSLHSALLLNCTFIQNSGRLAGALGALGAVSVENSILWNNLTDSEVGAGIIYLDFPPDINYSVLQNWTPRPQSVGNVDLAPLFVDADGPDDIVGTEDDNLRLSMFSPLIDLGDPNPPLSSFRDADGHVRILRGRIDMGAYEFGIGDYDEDLFTTLSDFAAWDDCMTGPDEYPFDVGCEAFDFHAELKDHIDLLDFAGFQRNGFGPSNLKFVAPQGR